MADGAERRWTGPILLVILGTLALGSCDQITVTVVPVFTVSVTPGSATLLTDASLQLSVTPLSSAGALLKGRTASWSSSDSRIASVDENGLVTGAFSGVVTVTATIEGRSGSTTISVSGPSRATLQGGAVFLLVSEGAISAPITFTATTTTSVPASDLLVAGSTYDIGPSGTVFAAPVTLTLAYEPSNVPTNVAEAELRLFKVIGGDWILMDDGSVDTSARTVSGSITSLSKFGIRGLSVATVEVTPSAVTLEVSGTAQLMAVARTAEGMPLDSRPVFWSSSDDAVATVDDVGGVTARGRGTATISAMSGGRTGTAVVTVLPPVASVTVTPATVTMVATETRQLSAVAKDSEGAVLTGKVATWTSGNEAVATVSGTGLVTAVAVGSATITARIDGISGTSTITVSIGIGITTNTLPGGRVGTSYDQTVTAVGGSGAYAWVVSAGSLPVGLALASSTGRISGVPTTAGTSNFTVTVVSGGESASKNLQIVISQVPPLVTTTSLSDGVVGTAYNQRLSASGGDGAYVWGLNSGVLPAGLTLSAATGILSGTPTSEGTSSFVVQVVSGGETAIRALSITVSQAVLSVTTTVLADGVVDAAYSESLNAIGGDGSYKWSLSSGSLPAGLNLDESSGAITGTPTLTGSSDFTVKVVSGSQAAEKNLTIVINAGLSVTTNALNPGVVGVAYQQTLSAAGGAGSYTWSIITGTLPGGLSLDSSTGVISGTPGSAVTSTFTVQVTSNGSTASRELSIAIANPALSITTSSLPGGALGTAYGQTLAAEGGSGGYSWAISAGTLPDGLGLDAATGVISGTPTSVSTGTFTVEVTSGGETDTKEFSITVSDELSITTSSLPEVTVGTSYDQTLSAAGGSGSYNWLIFSGTLPEGLSLGVSTGVISGTPTVAGKSAFTVQVTSGDDAATASFSIWARSTAAWTRMDLPVGTWGLRSLWGTGPSDVFAASDFGIDHFDGATWSHQSSPENAQGITSIWGFSSTDVWATSWGILHFDGSAWTWEENLPQGTYASVWGPSPTEVYAVGREGLIARYNGAIWIKEAVPEGDTELLAIHGAGGRIFAVGRRNAQPPGTVEDPYGAILERIDGAWQSVQGHPIVTVGIRILWVVNQDLAFVVDGAGLAVFDGTSWSTGPGFPSGFLSDGGPRSVWGLSLSHIYVVGQTCLNNDCDPTILFYNGSTFEDQTPAGIPFSEPLQGVWGTPDGSTVFFVGSSWPDNQNVTEGFVYRKTGG